MEFAPPPATDFEIDIGPREIDFYAENGYLVYRQMTTSEELEWLTHVYDTLISRPRSGYLDTVFDVAKPYGSTAPPKLGQLLFPERLVPAIRDTAMWRNARRVAIKLLDVPAEEVEHWGHILYKEGGGGNETPWHQDEAYWDFALQYHAIGAWMPLQDVDVDNGCLWFVPGSHRGDVLNHRHLRDDPAIHVLETTETVDTSAAVAVPLPAGGMSFHHPRLLHYSGANSSGQIRRAWANEFQTAPVQRDRPADRPWITAGIEALTSRMKQRSDS